MKKIKRVLSTLLAVVLLIGLLPTNILAADIAYAVEGGNIYFDAATGTITDCDTSVTSVNIPEKINGVSVTAIGKMAFEWCSSLEKITIPNSVHTIGLNAFHRCTSLTEITIPDSVHTIDDGAFYDCTNLTKVTLPNGITSVSACLFYRCHALTGVIIPDTVTSIEYGAFTACFALTQIVIPDGVTLIEDDAFKACTSMSKVTIPDSVMYIRNFAFSDCDALTDVYYTGTEAQWDALASVVGAFNDALTSADIHFNSSMPIPAPNTAYPSTQMITIDGKSVELQAYALKDENGYDTNYVKLRDVAYLLNGSAAQFNVTWDGAVNIVTETAYVVNFSEMKTPFSGNRTYAIATAETKINGATADLEAILLTDDLGGGYTYYKLRDLGQAIGFNVSWISGVGITIATDEPYSDEN